MKTFNSLKEMKPYYNKNTNTYEFVENGLIMDVEFKFILIVESHITARNINAGDINAWDINAYDINAWNINASNIIARDINARNITADDITAWDITAEDITADDISYYAVCFAYNNITCSSIKGDRGNAKHFVLDGKITIKKQEKKQEKKPITLELTDEQLAKIKSILEELK